MISNWFSTIAQAFSKPLQWWVVIAPWEQGLRVRLGKTSIVLRSGIHFRIPWLDRVYVQSIRERTIIETNQTATTRDGRTVTFSLATNFRIYDIQRLFDSLSSPEITIGSRAIASATSFIATHERAEIDPESIGQASTAGVQLGDWGIADVLSTVTAFSEARTYRIMTNEYRTGTNLWNIDTNDSGLR